MTFFPIHNFYVENGSIKPVPEFVTSANKGGVYEVIRVENGVPVFIEEHLSRFFQSIKIAKKNIPFSNLEIIAFVKKLIAENRIQVGNMLISYERSLKIFFIKHKYPTREMVKKGVLCGILNAERENPNVKVLQTEVREKADKLISEKKLYEVILTNKLRNITEGSRSNIFFIKENRIITPPGRNVLLGITRKKIIELIKKSGYLFFEEEVNIDDLPAFDAVFLTGTSPKVLPVKQIETTEFNPQNKIIQQLITEYDLLITKYIQSN